MKFKRLVSEDGVNVSNGRLAFWILLIINIYFWLYLKRDVPSTLFNSWWIVLIYNFGKKGIGAVNAAFEKKRLKDE